MNLFKYRNRNLKLDYYDHYIDPIFSENMFKYFEKNTPWRNNFERRTNVTYGDPGLIYEIDFGNGKVRRKALDWTPELTYLRDLISQTTNQKYNICVVQRYPNFNISINPHRDKEMTPGTTVCGLSFGATRTLRMSKNKEDIDIKLGSGSLYILYPPTNDYWSHSILKEPQNMDQNKIRISLTFRNYTS